MASPEHDDLELLKSAGKEAGDLALSYFRRDPQVWLKEGGSPVSEADIAVDQRLSDILRAARPDYGWLSEETVDSPERLGRQRVFVVDPIDGTRAFLAGHDEWTVSLAIVENGRPISAALVGPALSVNYSATVGGGAFNNGRRLAFTPATGLGGARFASATRYTREVEAESGSRTRPRYVPSLAYRLALVASGEIDVAIVRPTARDWDLAAADLLVQEAGARLSDLSGKPLLYNARHTGHPTLVATAPELFDQVVNLVNTVHARHETEGQEKRHGGDARS
ncbi:3'(2'),5'-bisphosphate nucleotidase CysQ [Bauldia litoralis]|uniref:Myo-inositol-1(Or 4)-monophosphatase n=1 Tax=Bauldia litoralis TaxID=665467 RepID=A0A1G6C5B5_9HYPH|nr:3'(2'),5'-bisphosphate nucleotidase CysQ [Bauldia litoralis]SDB28052.1 myo-inositol-1(or 4)-monophosphatase [Bauldia litoralis]